MPRREARSCRVPGAPAAIPGESGARTPLARHWSTRVATAARRPMGAAEPPAAVQEPGCQKVPRPSQENKPRHSSDSSANFSFFLFLPSPFPRTTCLHS